MSPPPWALWGAALRSIFGPFTEVRFMTAEAPFLTINSRRIGAGQPTYVVAEMSANHNRDFQHAVRIIEAAKQAGADAIKLQTYTADTLTMRCDNEYFRVGKGTLWEGRTLYDLYEEAHTPWDWQPKLKRVADELKMDLFSTPFDDSAVDFLETMSVPAYKIASFELVDLPLIRKVAGRRKPMIMSTGMASLAEIDTAVRTARAGGCDEVALLKCTSAYPAPPEEMNLRTIPHLAESFNLPVGLSDHTLGVAVPVAAVALGACIIEKHFTLSRKDPGPDSTFSLEPAELKQMIDSIRVAEKAVGQVRYEVNPTEQASKTFRRSLFVVADIKAGEVFTSQNVRCIRPGHGLAPHLADEILGRRAVRDIARGTPLRWDLVSG
jgi:pseudaminic acid synthase